MTSVMTTPLLDVSGLKKHFVVGERSLFGGETTRLRAVDGVDFSLAPGETLGLVGESGCGKSTTGRLILRLIEPSEGRVLFDGRDMATLSAADMRRLRASMQIVFQDPYGALDPRMIVEDIIVEPLVVQGGYSRAALRAEARKLLEMVGLPAGHATRYPHEFSGGQRQRIGIARAIASRPKLVVCDEAVSALDVSVQAQIVNLLQDLQDELKLSYLFIAHDLAVVRHIAHRVAVMYLGRIVEIGEKRALYKKPLHPYTQALLASVPVSHPRLRKARLRLRGELPTPINPPTGCHFHPRCPFAQARCAAETPALREIVGGRRAACHFAEDIAAASPSLQPVGAA